MILGEGNEKMSKSKGNVVNPDDITKSHGADTLRLYEMFMGPLDASVEWTTTGVDGARRFLDRVWRLLIDEDGQLRETVVNEETTKLDKVYNETIKKVTEDFDNMHFNTAISQMMVFVNEAYKVDEISIEYAKGLVKVLSPIAPHIAEELWEKLGETDTIAYTEWPTFDESKLVEDEVEILVQVLGKPKARIMMDSTLSKDEVEKIALNDEKVKEAIEGKTIRKVIVVPGKLVNIVAN